MEDVFLLKRQLLDEVEQSLFFPMTHERIRELSQKIAEQDPEFLLKTCVFARNHLNIRKCSNDLFSCAAGLKQCAPFLIKYVFSSVNLPKDWLEVLGYFKNQRRPVPAALRKALALKFTQFDEYQLAKYNTVPRKVKRAKAKEKLYDRMLSLQKKYSKSSGASGGGSGGSGARPGKGRGKERFVVKMKRPTPLHPERLGVSLKQAVSFLHISKPAERVMPILGRRYPGDFESFTRSGLPGEFDPQRAHKRMKLAIPETWETLVSREGNVARTWETLLADKKLPFMAMLRNIRNFIFTGMGAEYHNIVLGKLQNENAVASSRQFPFQFLNAYNEVPKSLDELRSKVAQANSGDPKKDIKPRKRPFAYPPQEAEALLGRYREALSRAVELSASRNILPIEGCSDVLFAFTSGGKPSQPRRGQASAGRLSDATPAVEKSALLALLCARACERADILLPTGPYAVDAHTDLMGNVARVAAEGARDGGGELDKLFVDHVYELVTRRAHRTSLFLITDRPFDAKKVEFALSFYRRHVNPRLLFVYIACGSTKESFSFDDTRRNIVASASASEAVLRFISTNNGDMAFVEHLVVAPPKGFEEAAEKRAVPLPYRSRLHFLPAAAADTAGVCRGLRAVLPWKTVRIFVSSTFADFQSERDVLVDEVVPVLRERAARMRVRVFDIDLRWGVLEKAPPLPLCLRLVDESQIFVGFLGHRYGHAADIDTLSADETTFAWAQQFRGRSVTELEFRRGFLTTNYSTGIDTGSTSGRHRGFVYVRDDQTLDTLPADVLGLFTSATPAQRAQVAALRACFTNPATPELAKHVVPYHAAFDRVEETQTPGGCCRRVLLKGLDDLKARLTDDLWGAIVEAAGDNAKLLNGKDAAVDVEGGDAEALPGGTEDSAPEADGDDGEDDVGDDDSDNGSDDGGDGDKSDANELHQLCTNCEANVVDYVRHFVGRKYFVEEVETFCLQQGFGTLALCGRDGCGSTALLAKLAVELQRYHQTRNRTNARTFTCVYFPGRTTTLKDILLDIAARLGTPLAAAGLDLTEAGNKFLGVLRSRSESTRVTLFINDLDRVPQALEWLSAVGTLPCRLVFSAHCAKEALGCPAKDVPALRKEEAVEVIERTFRDFGKTVSPKQVRTLASKSDAGLPLYLSLACEEVRVHGVFETVDRKFASLPQRLKDLVQKETIPRLLRIGGEGRAEGRAAGRSAPRTPGVPEVLLCAIALSKNGLNERELLAYANAATAANAAANAAAPLSGSATLGVFLPRLEGIAKLNEDERYYFPYAAVVEAVDAAFGLRRDAAQWHRRLAELLDASGEVGAQGELVHQLLQTGTLPALRRATDVLCSVRGIEARIKDEERHTPAHRRLPLRVADDLRDLRQALAARRTDAADATELAALAERADECCEVFATAGRAVSTRESSFIQYCLGRPATSALYRDAKRVLAAERRAASAPHDASTGQGQGQGRLPSLLLRQAFMSTVTNGAAGQSALVATFEAAHAGVTALCFSGDSRLFAVGSSFGTVKVYTVADTALAFVLGGAAGSAVTALAFSGFLDRVAVGYADGGVRVYRLAEPAGEPRELVDFRECAAHHATVSALAFFGAKASAQFLVTGSFDRGVAVWDAATLACVCKQRRHRKPVTDVVLRGDRVLATSWDGQVSMYRINEANELVPDGELRAEGHLRRACFAGVRAGEALVLGVGMDGATLFDAEHKRALLTGRLAPREFDVAETLLGDGTRLVVSAVDRDLTLLDAAAVGRRRIMETAAELGELQCDLLGGTFLVYVDRTANAVHLVASSPDAARRLSPEGLLLAPACLAFCGRDVLYTVGSELHIHQNKCSHRSCEFRGDVAAIAGDALLSATKNDLHLYKVAGGSLVQTACLRFENASAVCVGADAATLCAGSRGGDLAVYERDEATKAYAVRCTRCYPAAACTALALVGGGVAAGFSNGALMLVGVAGAEDSTLSVHRGGVAKILPYRNGALGTGTYVLTLGSDGSAYLTDVAARRVVVTLAQTGAVAACCLDHEPVYLCTRTGGVSCIEEVTFGASDPVATVKAHDFAVTKTRFSPDARLLLSGDAEGVTKLWDVGRAVGCGARAAVAPSAYFKFPRAPHEEAPTTQHAPPAAATNVADAVGTLVEPGAAPQGSPPLRGGSDCTQFSEAPLSATAVLADERVVACGYESGEVALFRFDGSLYRRLDRVAGAVRCITPVWKAHRLTELAVGDEHGAVTFFAWNSKETRDVLYSGLQGVSSVSVYEVGFRFILHVTPDFSARHTAAFFDYATKEPLYAKDFAGGGTFYRATACAAVSRTCTLFGTYQGWVFMTFVDDKTGRVVPVAPLLKVSSKPITGLALAEVRDAPALDGDKNRQYSLRFLASAGNAVYDCAVERYGAGWRYPITVAAVHVHPSEIVAFRAAGGVVVAAGVDGEITVTNTVTMTCPCVFQLQDTVTTLDVSFHDGLVFAGSKFGKLNIFSYRSGKVLKGDEIREDAEKLAALTARASEVAANSYFSNSFFNLSSE